MIHARNESLDVHTAVTIRELTDISVKRRVKWFSCNRKPILHDLTHESAHSFDNPPLVAQWEHVDICHMVSIDSSANILASCPSCENYSRLQRKSVFTDAQ